MLSADKELDEHGKENISKEEMKKEDTIDGEKEKIEMKGEEKDAMVSEQQPH